MWFLRIKSSGGATDSGLLFSVGQSDEIYVIVWVT